MLDVNRILKSDRLLRALTALTRKAFDALLPSFRKVFEAANQSTSKRRQRGPGTGRKAKIPGSVARITVLSPSLSIDKVFDGPEAPTPPCFQTSMPHLGGFQEVMLDVLEPLSMCHSNRC